MTTVNHMVYLICTVGKKSLKYRLAVRAPRSLKQNEFAYRFVIQIDETAWQERVKEIKLFPPAPQGVPKDYPMEYITTKPIGGQVADRLLGREPGMVVTDLSASWRRK